MPPIPLFDELNEPYIAAANEWARNHEAFSRISQSLHDFHVDQLLGLKSLQHDKQGRYLHYEQYADSIAEFHPFYQASWYALNDSMGEFFRQDHQLPEKIVEALPDLVSTVFYRTLALMNKQASDFSNSWLSKSIIQHRVLSSFHVGNAGNEIAKTLVSYRHSLESAEGMWDAISRKLLINNHHMNRYDFFSGKVKVLVPEYQEILENGHYRDVIGIILNTTLRADGHYYSASKFSCAMHSTAQLFSALVDRNDIGAGDIKKLYMSEKIKMLRYIETDYFLDHVAERFTPEQIEEYRDKPGYASEFSKLAYEAIKGSLTLNQRLNYFLSGPYGNKATSYADIDDWRNAIIALALDTGTILTFREALDLPLEEHFYLHKTQQYSAYIDSSMDIRADQHLDIRTGVSDDRYVHYNNVHYVDIDSSYLTREDVESEFEQHLNGMKPFEPCGWCRTPDGYSIDFPFPSRASEKTIKSGLFAIVAQLREVISNIQKSHHGVGDEVVLIDGEYELSDVSDLPIGSKHILSKVSDGEAKLVGVIDMIPLSNLAIVKKGVPEKQIETSLSVG